LIKAMALKDDCPEVFCFKCVYAKKNPLRRGGVSTSK
jgi:hypothetical protein